MRVTELRIASDDKDDTHDKDNKEPRMIGKDRRRMGA